MKRKNKNTFKVAATVICTSLLFACSNNDTGTSDSTEQSKVEAVSVSSEEASTSISEIVTYVEDDYYTDYETESPVYIELDGSNAAFESDAPVIQDDNLLTIKTGGTFVLSGNFNGQIAVDAEDKNTVRLVLNGVEITSSDSAAINVINAEKTTISLVEGTENVVTDGKEYVFPDSETDEPNAAIFSKADLTINGTGKLTVNGNYNNGIASKDELKVTGGNLIINAADDGLMGRDLVAVKDGIFTIEAEGDGIKSTNDEKASKGNIVLEDGTFNITSGSDGVQSEATLWVTNGTYTIVSGGGSPETIETNVGRMGWGMNETTSADTATDEISMKGIKAVSALNVTGGTFDINASDDGVHSNDSISISGGEFKVTTGDDGVHADNSVTTSGGNIVITKSYEGIEGKVITIAEGKIDITSSDDGINVGGGNDGSGMDMQASEDNVLTINGGYVVVNASGDGLDSNGSFVMTGGTVLVSGPTESMNGTLDYGGTFEMSGGLLLAAGSSGMVQAASEASTQNSILMTFPETQAAGTIVHVEDSEGNTIATFAPEKTFQSVLVGSPDLIMDETYVLYSGGKSTGDAVDGLYTDGEYQDGTKVVEFTITESVTWLNESGITEAQAGGGRGGFGGNQPQGDGTLTRPEDGGGMRGGMFDNLDDETREKVEAIMQQQREGTITQEEAQQQLEDLGVEFPQMGQRPQNQTGTQQ
ncbi:carbohydrate-binding domain-containing protein [Aquibacillus kalidii]|uniref:carbohydrate-binding domain-containing protein n=1 Tax=Aquibacillus kalidii TaxID=2762597 RepID=UPI0016496A9F|nr:carbohydrate-binding domain-containing protein [Aquibacillus kalidii]